MMKKLLYQTIQNLKNNPHVFIWVFIRFAVIVRLMQLPFWFLIGYTICVYLAQCVIAAFDQVFWRYKYIYEYVSYVVLLLFIGLVFITSDYVIKYIVFGELLTDMEIIILFLHAVVTRVGYSIIRAREIYDDNRLYYTLFVGRP